MGEIPSPRFVLRDLSFPARLVLSLFLISVGFGYISAMVQLHFNGGAKPGEFLPDADDAVHHYRGVEGKSQLERLITADETKPFTGGGQMRQAFTNRSTRWQPTVDGRAQVDKTASLEAERGLRKEREIEILALVDWIRAGAKKHDYEKRVLPPDLAERAKEYMKKNEEYQKKAEEFEQAEAQKPEKDRVALKGKDSPQKFFREEEGKIIAQPKVIVATRCVKCHYEGARGAEGEILLDDYLVVHQYAEMPAEDTATGMSLTKLAQTTHVHLLGFSMLYGLTGLIFAFSSYPGWLRALVGPWALVAQLADISCWWLARADPLFGRMIVVTGGLVAVGLVVQVLGSLFNMYNLKGKVVLLLLILALCGVFGVVADKYVIPQMKIEKDRAAQADAK